MISQYLNVVHFPQNAQYMFTWLCYISPKMEDIFSPGWRMFSQELSVYFHLVAVAVEFSQDFGYITLQYTFPKMKGII